MRKITLFTAALGLLALVQTAGATTFENAGFEASSWWANDLTGWAIGKGTLGMGTVNVTDAHPTSLNNTYYAKEGNNFAVLTAGDLVVDNFGVAVPNRFPTTLSQQFTIAPGQGMTMISGWAAFDALDYGSFADYGYVRILDALGAVLATPFYDAVTTTTVPSFDGPWTRWSWITAMAGTYTLEFGVANVGDDPAFPAAWNPSMLLVDDISVTAVPEPSSIILSMAGLVCLVMLKRRTISG